MKLPTITFLALSFFLFSPLLSAGNIADPNDPNYDADADPCFDLRSAAGQAASNIQRILDDIRREMDNIARADDAQAAGLQASAEAALSAAQAAAEGAVAAAGADVKGFGEAIGNLTVAIGNFLPGVSGVDLNVYARIRLEKLSDELVEANKAAAAAKAALDECVDSYEEAETGGDGGTGYELDNSGNSSGTGRSGGSAGGGSGSGGGNTDGNHTEPDWNKIKDFSKSEVENALGWVNQELDACRQFPASEIKACASASVRYMTQLRNKVNKGTSQSTNTADRMGWVQMKQEVEAINASANEMRGR